MALWGGRFEAGVAEGTQEFGASLPVDKHLYKQDIAGSKAHAKMLAAQGIISAEDEQAIAEGLSGIEQDIDARALIRKEVTHHALGAHRLPPDVALRAINPSLQAHRDVLDLCSIELGREGK
mgnify:CR=1 FL=1